MRWICFFIIFIICSRCNNDALPYLPKCAGSQGEIMVVCGQQLWQSEIGNTIGKIFSQTQFGLPQDEPIFNIVSILPENFSAPLYNHRNIFIVNITDTLREKRALLEVKKNEWASGQILIRLSAKNDSLWQMAFLENKEKIIQFFQKQERERIMAHNKKYGEEKVAQTVKEKFNISLIVPKKSYMAKQTDDFCWIRIEDEKIKGGKLHTVSQGILIYYYNDTTKAGITKEYLLAIKDSITKEHIPGTTEGSYMATYYDSAYSPRLQKVRGDGNDYYEIRGLWNVEGNFMGGPFISLTTRDNKRNRMITVEGYVFAPEFDKREYLREMEAVLYSLEW